MIIEFIPHSFGYWVLKPVNERIRAKIKSYLAGFNVSSEGDVLAQYDFERIEAARDFKLSKTEIRDLNNGYSIRKRVDNDLFLHWVGYDAHEGLRL